ncbi:MAG TPA: hypothetical protein VME23_10005 [Terracidiphilus sp.]|nr:hypothetical protein [Terracidiphilus sp.]
MPCSRRLVAAPAALRRIWSRGLQREFARRKPQSRLQGSTASSWKW